MIYVSGPITHHVGPDPFGPVKARLEELGYEVLNPKDVPACPDRSCTLLPHEIEKNFEHSWACYLKYDLAAMLQKCDSILMLNGWQDSHGARLEMSTAAAVGFDILFEKDIFTPTVADPEPHYTRVGQHGDHWDASCVNSSCSWSVVNTHTRDGAHELAEEHEKAHRA